MVREVSRPNICLFSKGCVVDTSVYSYKVRKRELSLSEIEEELLYIRINNSYRKQVIRKALLQITGVTTFGQEGG